MAPARRGDAQVDHAAGHRRDDLLPARGIAGGAQLLLQLDDLVADVAQLGAGFLRVAVAQRADAQLQVGGAALGARQLGGVLAGLHLVLGGGAPQAQHARLVDELLLHQRLVDLHLLTHVLQRHAHRLGLAFARSDLARHLVDLAAHLAHLRVQRAAPRGEQVLLARHHLGHARFGQALAPGLGHTPHRRELALGVQARLAQAHRVELCAGLVERGVDAGVGQFHPAAARPSPPRLRAPGCAARCHRRGAAPSCGWCRPSPGPSRRPSRPAARTRSRRRSRRPTAPWRSRPSARWRRHGGSRCR